MVVSRYGCRDPCCSRLKRKSVFGNSGAKSLRHCMRYSAAILRELPPRSLACFDTAVPRLIPSKKHFCLLGGSAVDKRDACFGLQFSCVAHVPYIDELPSAWSFGRRDVNRANFVMWDKSGGDVLFSLWRDGTALRHAVLMHRARWLYMPQRLTHAQVCAFTATLLAATWTAPPLPAIPSARKGPSCT